MLRSVSLRFASHSITCGDIVYAVYKPKDRQSARDPARLNREVVVAELSHCGVVALAKHRAVSLAHAGDHSDGRPGEAAFAHLCRVGLLEDAKQAELLASRPGSRIS